MLNRSPVERGDVHIKLAEIQTPLEENLWKAKYMRCTKTFFEAVSNFEKSIAIKIFISLPALH